MAVESARIARLRANDSCRASACREDTQSPPQPLGSLGRLCFENTRMRVLLTRCLLIGFGGFLGSIARYGVVRLVAHVKVLNIPFPLATMFINVSGSMFLGWFLTFVVSRNLSDLVRLAIGTGFVGAYTTFSTYMYETNSLADDGYTNQALLNLVGSLILGIIGVRLGITLARRF
jgi:fluoride exporter